MSEVAADSWWDVLGRAPPRAATGGPTDLAAALVEAAIGRGPVLLDARLVLLDDALRAAAAAEGDRALVPLVVAAQQLAASPWRPLPAAAAPPAGVDVAAREQALWAMLYADPCRLGPWAPIAAATASLRAALPARLAEPLLASWEATWAALAARPLRAEEDAHLARVAPIVATREAVAAAERADKAAAFAESRFRAHLVDGDAARAELAMAKALAFGVPRSLCCGSLALAAAERLLRFDEAVDAAALRRERWADVAWLVSIAAAVRRLALLAPGPRWLDLMLWATWQVQAGAVLDGRDGPRRELPEPAILRASWDHGPEIASIVAAWMAGDGSDAIARLRGYLLMGLPEAPLTAGLVEAAFLDRRLGAAADAVTVQGTMGAAAEAFAALGTHPHRERLLAAALRLATARRSTAPGAVAAERLLLGQPAGGPPQVPWTWVGP